MPRTFSPDRPPGGSSASGKGEAAEERFPLRLSVTGGRLGIELYEPLQMGPLRVDGLLLTLPGLRFPVDLSGGVRPFRNRRGELQRLTLSAELRRLESWLAHRLAALGQLRRPPSLWRTEEGVGLGFVIGEAAWACELLWVPDGHGVRLVVSNARAAGVRRPALAQVLQLLESLGELGRRKGRVFHLPELAARACRHALPAVGARSPKATGVAAGPLLGEGDDIHVELSATTDPPPPSAAAVRALEFAALVSDADDALATDDVDVARSLYVAALERAPRHPEITRLVAELDAWVSERAEAALGMVVEAMPVTACGVVGAELLAHVRDFEGARRAIQAAASAEPYGPVAALAWLRLAALVEDAKERADALDLAVASSPSLLRTRWARFEARSRQGDVSGGLADVEHMEAALSGAEERHDVLVRAAATLLDFGYVAEAGRLFERALRYLPEDAAAALGLARAMVATGKFRRAASLLDRAIQLATDDSVRSEASLELAKLLAFEFRDLPQAIARAQQVVAQSTCVVEARAREGSWRAELGDLAGASLAYGRLREACELERVAGVRAADWLRDAARFEGETMGDAAAAERHMAVALRLRPRDQKLAEEYRAVAARVARQHRPSPAPQEPSAGPPTAPVEFAGAADDALVEELRERFLASPHDEQLRRQLTEAFESAGRDEELFALLSAQRDEATAELAAALRPHLVGVLRRLATRMREQGRAGELEAYEAYLRGLL